MNSLVCNSSFFGEILPVVLIIVLILSLVYYIKDKIQDKRNINKLKVARVLYSVNLFDELKVMEKSKVFRLYAEKVSDELYVITTSISGEEYKNGKIVSYFNSKAKELETKLELLSEFVGKIERLKLNNFAKLKVGRKVRIGE